MLRPRCCCCCCCPTGSGNDVNCFCSTGTFTRAYSNCLQDNCVRPQSPRHTYTQSADRLTLVVRAHSRAKTLTPLRASSATSAPTPASLKTVPALPRPQALVKPPPQSSLKVRFHLQTSLLAQVHDSLGVSSLARLHTYSRWLCWLLPRLCWLQRNRLCRLGRLQRHLLPRLCFVQRDQLFGFQCFQRRFLRFVQVRRL